MWLQIKEHKRAVDLKPGVVYAIDYACDTPGHEVEEGGVIGFWNGDRDECGKLTILPVSGGPPHYLFPREIVALQPLIKAS